jgi:hypothetical protein
LQQEATINFQTQIKNLAEIAANVKVVETQVINCQKANAVSVLRNVNSLDNGTWKLGLGVLGIMLIPWGEFENFGYKHIFIYLVKVLQNDTCVIS